MTGTKPDSRVAVLWRRLDRPGHDAALLLATEGGWLLRGRSAFAHARGGCGLAYEIACDANWRTRSVEVNGWVVTDPVHFEARVDSAGRWTVGGARAPSLAACVDVDLNFSPATNLLPIRRLAIPIGEERPVLAAWVRFPEFTAEPLPQVYRRLSAHSYRYVSGGGAFEREIEVDGDGFVTRYPGFFEAEKEPGR